MAKVSQIIKAKELLEKIDLIHKEIRMLEDKIQKAMNSDDFYKVSFSNLKGFEKSEGWDGLLSVMAMARDLHEKTNQAFRSGGEIQIIKDEPEIFKDIKLDPAESIIVFGIIIDLKRKSLKNFKTELIEMRFEYD
ncbi:MAG: hypothetical protein ACRCU6_02150 [Fusobacteriaceae bacterium]